MLGLFVFVDLVEHVLPSCLYSQYDTGEKRIGVPVIKLKQEPVVWNSIHCLIT